MTWKHGGRRGYHHGNLREALIESALELISAKGPSGFTIAEAARLAGVSPAAPYRHFRDREDLIADIARLGFERFGNALEAAWNGGKPTPQEALKNTGRAYIAFARNEPAAYAAMFESGIPHNANPELQRVADRAFGVLYNAATVLIEALAPDKRPPALMVALHIWSMSHGIVSLFARGINPPPLAPEDLLEAGVLIYLRGLGLNDGVPPT